MPHSNPRSAKTHTQASAAKRPVIQEKRYTVGLAPALADQVAQYAQTADTSMSKALAALVRLGLEGHKIRKREFFSRLKANLANDDPHREDQMVDEFRALILGH
jgi:hypothetical protein